MRNLLPIATGRQVLPLHLALMRQPWLWNTRTSRTGPAGSVHAETDDIWLRANPIIGSPEPHNSEWMAAYYNLPEARPLIFDLMRMVEGVQLGGVLITRIPPGCSVKPHVDLAWHAQYYDKYVIQVAGNPKQSFVFNEGGHSTNPGDVFWFNNQQVHSVTNDSHEDRISLIVCIRHDRRIVETPTAVGQYDAAES